MHHLGHIAADYRNGVFAGTSNLVKVINGELPMTVESFVHTKREGLQQGRDQRHFGADVALLS